MKKTYNSPEFDCLKFSFEATMGGIQYSKNEEYEYGGNEGNEEEIGNG